MKLFDRRYLEDMAIEVCSVDFHYELLDCMGELSDGDLMDLINKWSNKNEA